MAAFGRISTTRGGNPAICCIKMMQAVAKSPVRALSTPTGAPSRLICDCGRLLRTDTKSRLHHTRSITSLNGTFSAKQYNHKCLFSKADLVFSDISARQRALDIHFSRQRSVFMLNRWFSSNGSEGEGGQESPPSGGGDASASPQPDLIFPGVALTPLQIPEVFPKVPVIAINRNPVFPRFVKMIEVSFILFY